MNNRKAGIILKKELYRVFGDKKLVFSLFIMPAIVVILVYGLMGRMIGSMTSDITEYVSDVTIVNAPDRLKTIIEDVQYDKMANITWLTEDEYAAQKESLEASLKAGNIELIVYMEKDIEEQIENYTMLSSVIPTLKLYYNSTENYSSQAYSVFNNVVAENYKDALLTERFGDTSVLTPFRTDSEIICKEEKQNTEFISMMLPYLIVMLLFAGVMSIGVDAIAGEKERGTLSSMLISPVKRSDIVVGKLVSMAILAGISAVIYCVSMIIAMSVMGSEVEEMGFGNVSFGFLQIIELLAIVLGLVYMYVGIVGFLAAISKDMKTATSMVSPVYIVVVLAGMVSMFSTGKVIPAYRYLIPVYGNALAIKDICSNELTATGFLCSMGSTIVIGILLTVAITRAFNDEKLMFNA